MLLLLLLLLLLSTSGCSALARCVVGGVARGKRTPAQAQLHRSQRGMQLQRPSCCHSCNTARSCNAPATVTATTNLAERRLDVLRARCTWDAQDCVVAARL
jgi:hypothetical protein